MGIRKTTRSSTHPTRGKLRYEGRLQEAEGCTNNEGNRASGGPSSSGKGVSGTHRSPNEKAADFTAVIKKLLTGILGRAHNIKPCYSGSHTTEELTCAVDVYPGTTSLSLARSYSLSDKPQAPNCHDSGEI